MLADLNLVLSRNNSMMPTGHVSSIAASIVLDVKTARQRLQTAVNDTN